MLSLIVYKFISVTWNDSNLDYPLSRFIWISESRVYIYVSLFRDFIVYLIFNADAIN